MMIRENENKSSSRGGHLAGAPGVGVPPWRVKYLTLPNVNVAQYAHTRNSDNVALYVYVRVC